MIDQYPPANGVLTSLIWRKTMSGGETSLSGYDNASQALSYTPGQEQVYLNGILLVRGDDYTATNGTSITGLTALSALDFVQINCYNNFSVASLPSTSITGEISNSQITSLATSKLTGTVTNAQLAGSISNDKLSNSSITINGSAVALGGSATIAGGSAQDDAPASPTEGQLWLDTNGTLATTGFTEKATLTTSGDMYYASSASTPARLGIGSSGQVLTVASGVPSWVAPAGGGKVLQVVYADQATQKNINSSTFTDTELSGSITPTSASSKILVMCSLSAGIERGTNTGQAATFQLLRGSTVVFQHQASAVSAIFHRAATGNPNVTMSVIVPIMYYDQTASTTSTTTYKVQGRYLYGDNGGYFYCQTEGTRSTMILMEIGA